MGCFKLDGNLGDYFPTPVIALGFSQDHAPFQGSVGAVHMQ